MIVYLYLRGFREKGKIPSFWPGPVFVMGNPFALIDVLCAVNLSNVYWQSEIIMHGKWPY